jgi:hypothetical protein
MVRKYMRKQSMNVYAGSRMVTVLTKFEDIIADGNDTLFLIDESEIYANEQLPTSASEKGTKPQPNVATPKSSPKGLLESGSGSQHKRNRQD